MKKETKELLEKLGFYETDEINKYRHTYLFGVFDFSDCSPPGIAILLHRHGVKCGIDELRTQIKEALEL